MTGLSNIYIYVDPGSEYFDNNNTAQIKVVIITVNGDDDDVPRYADVSIDHIVFRSASSTSNY